MTKKPNGPTEKVISNSIIKWLRDLPETHARKVHGGPYGTIGEPDIDACIRGRTVKIEVKRPGKDYTLTPHQESAIRRWNEAGAVAFVATSIEDVQRALVSHDLWTMPPDLIEP